MDEGYTCCMCKSHFSGIAKVVNGAGSFCPECWKENRTRAISGMHERTRFYLPGACIWCGNKIEDDARLQTGDVCMRCRSGRDWLLKCIRFGPHAAEHVARIEAKEGPKRILIQKGNSAAVAQLEDKLRIILVELKQLKETNHV